MPKVTVTFEDKPDGIVAVTIVSDPQFPEYTELLSNAQNMAVDCACKYLDDGAEVEHHNVH